MKKLKLLCQPGEDGNCSQCGHPLPVSMRRPCRGDGPPLIVDPRARPTSSSTSRGKRKRHWASAKPPRLLGDRIADALTAIGITKEKWAAFVGEEGQPPGCSSCNKRQQKLNDADAYMRKLKDRFGEAAAEAVSKVWAPISWLKNKAVQSRTGHSDNPTMKG